jgi:hypothetical protein
LAPFAPGVPGAVVGCVAVVLDPERLDAVGFWPRCSTTAGRFAVGRDGAGSSVSPLGVVVGAGVDVVPAGAVVEGGGDDSVVVGAGVEVVVVGWGCGGGASWVVVGSVVVPVVV